MNKKIILLLTTVFTVFVSGCNNYVSEKMDEGTVIPLNSILSVEQGSDVHLIPNQLSTIRLSVLEIENKDVSDVFITANLITNMKLKKALIRTKSITFKAEGNSSTLPIDGFVTDKDGVEGIHIGCGKENIIDCGTLNIEYKDSWKVIITSDLDIGNQTLMIKRKT